MALTDNTDIREFPPEYRGRKTYVSVAGEKDLVAACYVYRDDNGRYRLYPEFGGPPIVTGRSDTIKMPYFVRDIGEYTSTLDGSRITTRSQHRDHMRRHDVIELGNERVVPRPEVKSRELGEAIKRRVDEVRAMPQKQYDEQVKVSLNGDR